MIVMKRTISVILATIMMLSSMLVSAGSSFAASNTSRPGRVTGVTIKTTEISYKSTLKWKKARRAKKYQIYKKAGNGKWKKVATVKAKRGRKTYKKVLKNLNFYKEYKFKVRAVNGRKKGKFSKAVDVNLSEISDDILEDDEDIDESEEYEDDEEDNGYAPSVIKYNNLLKYTSLDPTLQKALLRTSGEKYGNEIKALVSSLTEGCTTDRQKIGKIIEWWHQNISYYDDNYDDGYETPISHIWVRKYGVCETMARLLAYMFRCVDIPAGYYRIPSKNHVCTVFWMEGEWYSTDGVTYSLGDKVFVPYENCMAPITDDISGYLGPKNSFGDVMKKGYHLKDGYLATTI